jgi:hypothetical protein
MLTVMLLRSLEDRGMLFFDGQSFAETWGFIFFHLAWSVRWAAGLCSSSVVALLGGSGYSSNSMYQGQSVSGC